MLQFVTILYGVRTISMFWYSWLPGSYYSFPNLIYSLGITNYDIHFFFVKTSQLLLRKFAVDFIPEAFPKNVKPRYRLQNRFFSLMRSLLRNKFFICFADHLIMVHLLRKRIHTYIPINCIAHQARTNCARASKTSKTSSIFRARTFSIRSSSFQSNR